MFETGINMIMSSRHRLPDAAPEEREEHAHTYLVELTARGEKVNDLGYLVDIDDLKKALSAVLELYRDRCLNEMEDFSQAVPSLENLARAIWLRTSASLSRSLVTSLAVRVWEDKVAWAAYEQAVRH